MQQDKESGSEPAQRAADSRVAEAFFHSPDILCILNAQGHISQINPAWERILGRLTSEALGNDFLSLAHPDDEEQARRVFTALAGREGSFTLAARFRAADKEYRWLEWNLLPHSADESSERWIYATARDVTARRENEEIRHWQMNHDPLTGLPNSVLLRDRLRYLIAAAGRRGHHVAVLLIDMGRFRSLNDALGLAAGDAVLCEVARRLTDTLREEDTVTRLGSDEFVVVLPEVREESGARAVAEKITQALTAPYALPGGGEVTLSANVGAGLYPNDGSTPEELLYAADAALRHAPRPGSETEAASSPLRTRLLLESRLSQALEREELTLHYQPQISLSSGKMIGVEALMRWRHADLGLIPPAAFIPLAEETGLIVPMGAWAVREASRQGADWQRAGYDLKVSVNLSARQLSDPAFADRLERWLADIGLPARHINLELTESTFIASSDGGAIENLSRLKALGVQLSVDDFGTGYSSLAYLRRLPIDAVKIDRTFVTHLAQNAADEAVVRAVIDLSHTLGLQVIAEGVETEGQRDRLAAMGCDAMQGYLFSAAVPPGDVPNLFHTRRNDPTAQP